MELFSGLRYLDLRFQEALPQLKEALRIEPAERDIPGLGRVYQGLSD